MVKNNFKNFSEFDIHLFKEGTHNRLYKKFGTHFIEHNGKSGVYFALWAPNAKEVSVVGDFNNYTPNINPLIKRDDESGIWEGFIQGLTKGFSYKYHIITPYNTELLKADPFAFASERSPASASLLYDIDGYKWRDKKWLKRRAKGQIHKEPMNIYELHLGSWRKREDGTLLSYSELAIELVKYLKEMNYTHIELLPITEYPFDGSWGYQVSGYFCPTARFGTPKEFMAFIDYLHQKGIGVIMDWVPSHFVTDGHGLVAFDGTALYEYEDPRKGYHPEWKSAVFDYSKGEVRSFLISSAHFWLDYYHIDGIRVDAVASMLYLNYAREDGEWIPNIYGGNENLEAIEFLKELNHSCYGRFDGITMIAEESTAFSGVTARVEDGGLGFGFKWNMGWMHDTLKYFKTDPLFRKHHHSQITFSMWYAYDENFILPLSHDEVVHMKGSLLNKMPGTIEQKFANLRVLFAYMLAHPGKKLLFMGGEFGQKKEWDYASELEWELLKDPLHKSLQKMLSYLNRIYKNHNALFALDEEREGFEWVNENDSDRSVLSFLRKSEEEEILVICNFADYRYEGYRVPLRKESSWQLLFNTQDFDFGGWENIQKSNFESYNEPCCGKEYSLTVDLPALSVLYLRRSISS